MRHLVADAAVAARRGLDQDAVHVAHRQRHAVDLELGDVAEVGFGLEAADPRLPLDELFERVGVVERQHRRVVLDLSEALDGLATDPLAGTVGGDRPRVLLLERDQLGHHRVEVTIRDLRLGAPVELFVAHQLLAQLGDSL